MATHITIAALSLGDVRPYGWPENKGPGGANPTHGHEFELQVTLKFTKHASPGSSFFKIKGKDEEHVIEWPQKGQWNAAWDVDAMARGMPLLEWQEQIRFYNVDAAGLWNFVGEYNTDMFALAPRAKTFGNFYPGVGLVGGNGWCDPWITNLMNQGSRTLTTRPKPKGFDQASLADKFQLTARMFRDKSERLDALITDRPGMTKHPSGGAMAGGGGQAPLTNSPSRVRVIHFDLGFAGTGLPRVHATQILETQNGVPTICKFIKGRRSVAQVEDRNNHATWRQQIDLAQYRAPGNFNFL